MPRLLASIQNSEVASIMDLTFSNGQFCRALELHYCPVCACIASVVDNICGQMKNLKDTSGGHATYVWYGRLILQFTCHLTSWTAQELFILKCTVSSLGHAHRCMYCNNYTWLCAIIPQDWEGFLLQVST